MFLIHLDVICNVTYCIDAIDMFPQQNTLRTITAFSSNSSFIECCMLIYLFAHYRFRHFRILGPIPQVAALRANHPIENYSSNCVICTLRIIISFPTQRCVNSFER